MLRCHMVLALCVEQGEGGLAPMGLDLGHTPVGCHKTNPESCSPSSGDPPRHLLTHGIQYKARHHPRLRGKKIPSQHCAPAALLVASIAR